jgi:ABC-type uncharacterized transport system ATPase subunit
LSAYSKACGNSEDPQAIVHDPQVLILDEPRTGSTTAAFT